MRAVARFDVRAHDTQRAIARIVATWPLLAPALRRHRRGAAVLADALRPAARRCAVRLAGRRVVAADGIPDPTGAARRRAAMPAWQRGSPSSLRWHRTCFDARWRAWRRPLACLALSVLLSTLLVAWIKSWSNIDCPWDLMRYGGQHAYVDLFATRPAQSSPGRVSPPATPAPATHGWRRTSSCWPCVRLAQVRARGGHCARTGVRFRAAVARRAFPLARPVHGGAVLAGRGRGARRRAAAAAAA